MLHLDEVSIHVVPSIAACTLIPVSSPNMIGLSRNREIGALEPLDSAKHAELPLCFFSDMKVAKVSENNNRSRRVCRYLDLQTSP